jgi:hypothetical protein
MRERLLKIAAFAAVCLFVATVARADSTVPALTAASSLTGSTTYLAQGGALDRKLGFDTTMFGISTGNLVVSTTTLGSTALTIGGTTSTIGGLTLTSPSVSGTAAFGTTTVSGNLTFSNVPKLTGLSAGTQVSCMGLDASNNIVLLAAVCGSGGGTGTVTSVGLTVPGSSLFGVSGSPVTTSGNIGLTTTGTSGGIPYFSSTSQLSSSALLTANQLVLGGGAAGAPQTLGSLGTTTTVLHGNAGGIPSYAAVNLTSGADITGTLPVANGGTGLTSGTSGGVLAYTASGTLASSGALTANLPVIGGGAGVAPSVGTRSGNTTAFVTTTGTQTSGNCVQIDASGNHIAAAAPCGTGGTGTVTANGNTETGVTTWAFGTGFSVPGGSSGTAAISLTQVQNTPADGGSHSYTVLSSDLVKEVILANTFTGLAAPQATSTFGAGAGFSAFTKSAVTATSTTSTVNGIAGATGIKLASQQLSDWISDGTNWQVGLYLPQPSTQTGSTLLHDDMTWGQVAIGTNVSGLGTGVATALGVNVGSAGAFVTFNGALGTPSSGTLTNATGLPISTGVSGLGSGVATALGVAAGASGGILRAVTDAANPTAVAGASANNGSAATYMRSDASPAIAAASTSTAGIAKLHNVPVAIGWPTGLDPNNTVIAIINQNSTISAIIGVAESAVGATATVTVKKASSGTACSAGTALHSGTFNANSGSPGTNQTLTVTTSSLTAGDRLCLTTTGGSNWTSGSGIGNITVFLAPS